jgi:ABC-type Mn2+/Zn2+ transport system permease subunit/Mn-dependent DtxR family transcriptional regulator
MNLIDVFQESWAWRALLASGMVGLMCGVLGAFIVLRNMSLVGDALAHAILPGVVAAYVVVGYSALGFFVGAVVAGLITAVGITWVQHRGHTKNDAAIGIVFTAMFSLGVMGISYISRHDGVHLDLKDFLFGNVLGVADADLWLTALVTGYVLLSIAVFYRYFLVTTFQEVVAKTMGIDVKMVHYFLMLLLSFAVVASLQTVGVILVVAMLITPAATALLLTHRLERVLMIAGALGLLTAMLGLALAIVLETTPGPAMAVTATLIYVAAVIFAPRRGLLFKAWSRMTLSRRVAAEDMLKAAYRTLDANGKLDEAQWRAELKATGVDWRKNRSRLLRKGWLDPQSGGLSEKGAAEAERLVRAHRLWETYLANKVGVDVAHIHDEAERYEHLLTEEMLDDVDAILGYPAVDPHGSPIPAKLGRPSRPLAELAPGQSGRLAPRQLSEHVTALLWQYELLPGAEIRVESKTEDGEIAVEAAGRHIRIPAELARLISLDA